MTNNKKGMMTKVMVDGGRLGSWANARAGIAMTTNTTAAAGQAPSTQQNLARNDNGNLNLQYRLANNVPAPSVAERVTETNRKIEDLSHSPVSVDLEHLKMMQELDSLRKS